MASFAPALRTFLRPTAAVCRITARPLLAAPRATFVSAARLRYAVAPSFLQKDQPRLRLGSEAPHFTATTTHGKLNFHEFVLFSPPPPAAHSC
jgi:hypothetical protein